MRHFFLLFCSWARDWSALECIPQRADAVDFYFDDVSALNEDRWLMAHADAGGRAGEDDGAWEKGGVGAEEFQERRDIEDEVAGVAVLHGYAIDPGSNAEGMRVRDFISGDEAWTQRAKSVEGFSA